MNNEKLKSMYHFSESEIDDISKRLKLNKKELEEINDEFLENLNILEIQ